ncbi:MAG: hypothetical protein AB7Q29_19145 [Vicinamibacterales bacterium]
MNMRIVFLLMAAVAAAAPVLGQPPSPAADATSRHQPETTSADRPGATPSGSPVSLDRIREGLRNAPERPLLDYLQHTPDFTVQVEEQARLDAILSKLDFSAGPVPAGGLYAYEQQRRLFDPVSQPLMQPYAAFNGSQLVTIALQNLIFKYLGGRVLDAVSAAERARLNAGAREEVDRAIAAYCAAHPNRESIQLCTKDAER